MRQDRHKFKPTWPLPQCFCSLAALRVISTSQGAGGPHLLFHCFRFPEEPKGPLRSSNLSSLRTTPGLVETQVASPPLPPSFSLQESRVGPRICTSKEPPRCCCCTS